MTKIRSREQLLDAAAKVFGEKGYEAARLEDIAAELGVLQGSLYYHVESKAHLFRLVRQRRFLELATQIEQFATSSLDPREKLWQACRAHLLYIERYLPESPHWLTHPFESRKTDSQAEEDRRMTSALRASWRSIIDEGIEARVIREDANPSLVVLSVQGMLNWTAFWYDPEGPLPMEAIASAQFDLLWDGLSRRTATRRP